MNASIAEILRECPGCEVHELATNAAGDVLVLYVPPPRDLARQPDEDGDWGRVTRPHLLVIPAAPSTVN